MVFVAHILNDPVGGLLGAILLIGVSGVPGLLLRRPGPGQLLAVLLTCSAALWGVAGTLRILGGTPATRYLLEWSLPYGPCELSVDPLSALFLLPLFLSAACCSLYGRAYLPAAEQPVAEKRVSLFAGLLLASMALVMVARNSVLLLMAWEVMALSSWMLLMTNQRDSQVQRAGMVYLLATHTGTMFLFLLFSLLRGQTGTFLFPAAHTLTVAGPLAVVMLLAALIGFGAKAGIMPLHIWLPGAHANAPSHVSAIMSGIMLKVGLYGIIRTASFFHELPLWFGWLVLALGIVSAVIGIWLACSQQDLKRVLACSSIENIGIICIGIGIALVGMQSGNRLLMVLGTAGAFMHIINHALFKPLLFLGSGVIIHAAGSRQIDRMGGLSRILPRTAPLFLVGSVAICGLPPLNGFVGELFLYYAAFSEGLSAPLPLIAFVAPVLALVGGLAVITFVRLYGFIFLGAPRDPAATHGHEAPLAMLLPMSLLAGLCLLAGLGAPLLLRLALPVISEYTSLSPALCASLTAQVPLQQVALLNGLLLALFLLLWLVWKLLLQRSTVTETATWGCGYLAPTPRMQYSASSFAATLTGLFGRPTGRQTGMVRQKPHFPASARLLFDTTERILDQLLIPFLQGIDWCLSWLRRLQHGHLQFYILYVFATLFVLMVWSHL